MCDDALLGSVTVAKNHLAKVVSSLQSSSNNTKTAGAVSADLLASLKLVASKAEGLGVLLREPFNPKAAGKKRKSGGRDDDGQDHVRDKRRAEQELEGSAVKVRAVERERKKDWLDSQGEPEQSDALSRSILRLVMLAGRCSAVEPIHAAEGGARDTVVERSHRHSSGQAVRSRWVRCSLPRTRMGSSCKCHSPFSPARRVSSCRVCNGSPAVFTL
jgi:hypothetical protein